MTWTNETRQAAIAQQLALIAGRAVPMAVVDYGLGWRRAGVTAGRYGVRDLRQVKIYNLTVVARNAAAEKAA